MAGSLSGAWAKFDRAEEHLEALIRVTRSGHVRWGHQYPVTPEAHRNGLEYRFYVDRAPALDAEAGGGSGAAGRGRRSVRALASSGGAPGRPSAATLSRSRAGTGAASRATARR